MYLFLYAPIISLAVFSFNDSKSMAKWNGFSLRWYKKLLENDRILNALYYTIVIAIVAAVIALMSLYVFIKLEFGFTTMLLSHIVFDIPYVILSVLPKLKQLPANIEDAAMDLGATPWYALRKVVLPQIKPGIVSGMLIAFTMSIDDFVISFFTTGNGVTNLAIEIYSMTRRGLTPEINALSNLTANKKSAQ